MDGQSVGGNEHVEFIKTVDHQATIKSRGEFASGGVDIFDGADFTVVDLLVVIILDLHDLVSRREGPAKSLDLALPGRV